MIQDDPSQPGYGMPIGGYGDYESAYTQQRASYGAIPQGMLMGGYTVGAGAMQGMGNMMADVGRVIRPVSYTPPARVMVGYGGMYAQTGGLFSGAARYMGFGSTPRGVTEGEYDYYTASDLGERIAGGFTSGATSLAGLTVGAAAFTPVARAAGTFFGSTLGPMGAKVGGALGGMVGGYAMGMWAAGEVQEGIAQRREVQNFLENSAFRFATSSFGSADPRFGTGMSITARQQVANTVREMDFKDPMFNTQELTQVMQQSAQVGLFSGTRDVKEFQTRFKDIVESVKVVTRTLHQTLEEGVQTIKDLRSIGIDPSSAKSVVLEADARGKMAGRTGTEMMQLGLQGAELFRGTGVSMRLGYESNVMGLSAIRAARDAGELSQEAVAQAGGEEALAQRMTASGLGFAQSAMGRGFGAAFYRPGQGFNAGAFQTAAAGGGGSFEDMALRGAQNMADPRNVVSYQARQAEFLSKMGKTFGGQGLQMNEMQAFMKEAQFVARMTGGNVEDSFRYSLQSAGYGEPQIETMLARMKNAEGEFSSAQKAVQATYNKMTYDQAVLNSPMNRIGAKVGDIIQSGADVLAKPMSQLADVVKEGLITFQEKYYYGVQSSNTDQFGRGGVFVGNVGELARTGPLDLDRGGLGRSAGEGVANRVLSGEFAKAFGSSIGRRGTSDSAKSDEVLLDTNRLNWQSTEGKFRRGSGTTLIASERELMDAAAQAQQFLDVESKSKDAKATSQMMSKAEAGVGLLLQGRTDDLTLPTLLKRLTGKGLSDIGAEELAAVRGSIEGIPELQSIFDSGMSTFRAVAPLSRAHFIETANQAEDRIGQLAGQMEGSLSSKAAKSVLRSSAAREYNRRQALDLAARARSATTPEERASLEAQANAAQKASVDEEVMINRELARQGVKPGDRSSYLAELQDVSGATVDALAKSFAAIDKAEAAFGGGALVSSARSQVRNLLTGSDKELALDLLTKLNPQKIETFFDASDKEISALKGAGGSAAALARAAEGMKTLAKGGVSSDAAEKAVSESLPDINKSLRDSLVKSAQGDGAGLESLSRALQEQLGSGVSGVQKVGAGAGGMGDSDAETSMRTQTEINQQVLAVMRALATRLER